MTPERHAELVDQVRIWPQHFADTARELLAEVVRQRAIIAELSKKYLTCDGFFTAGGMGSPQPWQVVEVKRWLEQGCTVKLITQWPQDLGRLLAIKAWCKTHFGCEFPVIGKDAYDRGEG